MKSNLKEYIIDKNNIYKDNFFEIKQLLKYNEKIKLVTSPSYVPIAFKLAEELNEERIATYDEELKTERFKENNKYKTKIYLSIKRIPKQKEFFIDNNYFVKNLFEQIKNYLKQHDKAKIIAESGEVCNAFQVAKQLVEKGIALYDEELQLSRNFKAGKGKTKVIISLKRRNKEYIINKNSDINKNINEIKDLIKKDEKINIITSPKQVSNTFAITQKLINDGIALFDEETKIKRNFKSNKNKTKIIISLKRKNTTKKPINNINTLNNIEKKTEKSEKNNIIIKKDDNNFSKKESETIIDDVKKLLKENEIVTFKVLKEQIALPFKIAQILVKEGYANYNNLKIGQNFKEKGKTKILISINKKS